MNKLFSLMAGTAFLLVTGCGPSGPATYPVTGTITMDGKPIADATIAFVPMGGESDGRKTASGRTDAQGMYALTTFAKDDGALAGEYGIKVEKYEGGNEGDQVASDPNDASQNLDNYENAYKPDVGDPRGSAPRPKNVLPKKYSDVVTSGLTYKVTEEGGTFDIELTK